MTELQERDFTSDQRKMMAKSGMAMADGSYPIENKADLQNAIHAVGRGSGSHAAIKAHIVKRAKALGATDMLPPDWSGSTRQESVRTGYFAELADLREAQLDGAEFIARGVTLIRPGFSTNADKAGRHRYYPKSTLEAAAAKYDGTRAYFNHPTPTQVKELPERDVRDIAGYFDNVKAGGDGRLMGDLHILGHARETAWPLIAEAVAHKPDLIQLSSNAIGQTVLGDAEGQKAIVVESIVGVNSVDLVTTGAAGGTFAGALLASDGDSLTRELLSAMSFEEWRESRPEFMDRLRKELKTARDDQALTEAQAARDKSAQELAELREQYRAELTELLDYRRGSLADRLLEASRLPHSLRPQVRVDMLTEKDAEAMAKRLEVETNKWRVAPRAPVSVSGSGPAPLTATTTAVQQPNVVAEVFGLNESRTVRPHETLADYIARTHANGA